MTTFTRSDFATHSPFPSLRRLVAAWDELRAVRRERNRIVEEMNTYTDQELLELGLFRSDIPAVADGTYRV